MTNRNSVSKIFTTSLALLALFAALGAAVFFTSNASAQTVEEGETTTEQAETRRSRRGNRGDRTPPTAEELAEAVANGDISQERADAIAARVELRALAQEVYDKDAAKAEVAEALGVTVEELEAAKEDGTMSELLEGADMTREDVRAIMQTVKAEQLAAAVEDGTITQEQADALAEGKSGRGRGHRGGGQAPATESIDA